jgi:predicted alpha/beta-fold hydrolase
LGGNALLRWAEEMGAEANRYVKALAAVCPPTDLAAAGMAIGKGFNRWAYTQMFLKTMKPKALRKLEQYPGLFDRSALMSATTLYDFDNAFTAPLHGYNNTNDYWKRASSKPHLAQISVPTLLVNNKNDPFVPGWSMPKQAEVGQHITLWQPAQGGHAGFPAGGIPGHVRAMPEMVGHWMRQHL